MPSLIPLFFNAFSTSPVILIYSLLLEVLNDQVISNLPVKTHPVSQGSLCIKGWNIHEFVGSDQRLKQPLLRKDGKLVPVSWDEAMDTAAQGLKQVVEKYGPDAVAVLSSPWKRKASTRKPLSNAQQCPQM